MKTLHNHNSKICLSVCLLDESDFAQTGFKVTGTRTMNDVFKGCYMLRMFFLYLLLDPLGKHLASTPHSNASNGENSLANLP